MSKDNVLSIVFLILLVSVNVKSQEERQLPRWKPFIEGSSITSSSYANLLREKLRERRLIQPGRGGPVDPSPPTNSHQRQPQTMHVSNENWESFKVESSNNPDVRRNVQKQSTGSYFPIENIRPLNQASTTSKTSEAPKKPDEADSGKSNFGSNIRRSDERVDLDTKYFQITERNDIDHPLALSTTAKPPSRGPILVKKLAKIPVPKGNGDFSRVVVFRNSTDLCKTRSDLLDCGRDEDPIKNEVKKASLLPAGFEPLLKYLRGEIWVVPVLVASACLTLVLFVFEIYLLTQVIRSSRRHQYPSRRHLFLGQMLIFGLFLCCSAAVVYTLKPSPIVCSVTRVSCGLAYSVVYSTLLVKLVFLISLNSGVYLPATYQALLLCFAVLIQLVIGIQWLVSSPADVIMTVTPTAIAEASHESRPLLNLTEAPDEIFSSCNVTFQQELLALLYVLFLVVVVVILAFKARGVRENYRESMYIGLTMGFTVCIFLVWMLAGLMVPPSYQDVCKSCGLVASSAITFIIMFMPKGRQLSAMGKEGVYAEDRTDAYTGTGSSTQSTASGATSHEGGTPSPSFFPVQPLTSKEMMMSRERLATPQSLRKHRNLSPTFDHILSTKHHFSNHHHSGDFHQAFHRQQRASHKAIFGSDGGGNVKNHSSHDHHLRRSPSHRESNHNHHKTSSRPAGHFFSVWRSDDEASVNPNVNRLSERWRRSRSSPPRGRHWLDSEVFEDRHRDRHHGEPTRWRATSHGDLNRALNDDSADEMWPRPMHRLPGFGFRSSHDLHAANERRASRNDLRELRERLLARGNSQNDVRASRRNVTVPKPWDVPCQACSNLNNHNNHSHNNFHNSPANQRNQNFHSYNPRPASADTEDLLFMRENEALFRY